ncbi:amino acid adenylation domain-containing protein [Paenibacillus shirakamiensis]|uniref:Amino acid adenylation domain-containing protein n=1 Tax=Paenibacillus shirakamiensis TaxID=1265935 RepID=A0ABS4JDG1_9BACL|nr:non-ribosomal peptide synthetase [Paenibacillus shirakamiensis]MBP1998986.1 amino acid adenylation domain-containing protein [Paenibacillus shirakamiensis]
MMNVLETKAVVQTSTTTNVLLVKKLTIEEISKIHQKSINQDHVDLFITVEQVPSPEMYEEYIKREKNRAIGLAEKIRITLILNENNATLVLTSDLTKANLSGLLQVYNDLLDNIQMIELDADEVERPAKASIKWGVPLLDEATQGNFNEYNIVQLKGQSVSHFALQNQAIYAALAQTLKLYGDEDLNVYAKSLTMSGQTILKGKLNQDGTINPNQQAIQNGESAGYTTGIISIDVDNKKFDYTYCLSPKYPLTCVIKQNGGVVHSVSLQASVDTMDSEVLRQFGTMLEYFLTPIQADSDSSMNEVINELMTPFGRRTVVLEQENILDRLEKIERQFAQNIALSDTQGDITFEELAQRSDSIATHLIKEGLKTGDKAVISVKQDNELVLLMIGVIKAGGVYIPVDPNYPEERISFILKDSGAKFFISNLIQNSQDEDADYITIQPSGLLQQTQLEPHNDLLLPAYTPQSGYVIYTSGTSGVPKGVQVSCDNIIALVEATQEEFELSAHDVWTMFHSSSFDFSVWEMWGSLLSGAKLVVVPRETATSMYDFYDLLIEHHVTVLNQTPSSFYALQNIESEQRIPRLNSIRLIIFGGEALDNTKLKKWFQRYSSSKCRLVNMYGITETTVHVTYQNIFKRNLDTSSQSIGVPIKGWKISVRDPYGVPCLLGVEGEIWVGGAGLSNGYINREKLNTEKFIIDKLSGERWYKSGDLGKIKSDGSIDYLGRIDNQVKIRGYRIELDEIKKHVSRIPGVREVVVTVQNNDKDEHKQIIAFFESNKDYSSNDIRDILMKELPSYMIPSKSVHVEDIPLTINGKIDFKKLLDEQNEPYQAKTAANSGENVLLEVWCKILGQQITDEDNFFDCGGNSLLAVSLLSELKQKVSKDILLRDLYVHSSPSSMRAFLKAKERGEVSV